MMNTEQCTVCHLTLSTITDQCKMQSNNLTIDLIFSKTILGFCTGGVRIFHCYLDVTFRLQLSAVFSY